MGRALWPALLLVLAAHAFSDLLHHPFLGDTGDAAIVDAHLTLWVPATEAGAPSEAVARRAAASLVLTGRPATMKRRTGGATGAVTSFLGPDGDARPGDLLVVSSATIADLARAARDPVLGERASEATAAQAQLRGARVVAMLGQSPLTLVVPARSHVRSGTQLVHELQRDPRSHLFAVEGDAWTKTRLARIVQRAGVPGLVPYRAYPDGGEAGLGLEAGDADVALVPADAVRDEVTAGRLRRIPWPRGWGSAPHAWTALVEPPTLHPDQRRRLRAELAALARDPGWRRSLRRAGWSAGSATPPGRDVLARKIAAEARLQRVAALVDGA